MHRGTVRIGLALGSGAARGWGHIGVIRTLEKHGISPQVVCGTSIGAVVGGAYASGKMDELESFAREITWRHYLNLADLSVLKMDMSGLIYGDKILSLMKKASNNEEILIESLDKPFAAVATDLRTGKEIWLKRGSLFRAIRASIAIPGIFAPVKDLERSTAGRTEWLVDGALVNPVPVSLCRSLGADFVIAVNLNSRECSFSRKLKPKSFERAVWSNLMIPIPHSIQETVSSVSGYISKAAQEYLLSLPSFTGSNKNVQLDVSLKTETQTSTMKEFKLEANSRVGVEDTVNNAKNIYGKEEELPISSPILSKNTLSTHRSTLCSKTLCVVALQSNLQKLNWHQSYHSILLTSKKLKLLSMKGVPILNK